LHGVVLVFHRRSTFLGLAALSLLVFGSRDAPASANVLDATPGDGSVLTHAPERVVVRFASGIDTQATKISLAGPTGSSSLTIEGSGGQPMRELSIPVPDQGKGRYLVRWEVVATGGERYGGKVRFVVKK
jgi:methionine-rich copper-binding protein CopC